MLAWSKVFRLSIFFILLLLSCSIVYASSPWDFLTKGRADNLYCSLTGCVISGDLNVSGVLYSVSTVFVNSTGDINTTGRVCSGSGCLSPHTNLTAPDILALGFAGNCSESDSCSNIVYDGEIVINGSTPHTNRTDAEIRTIASEFNETLWVQAQGYLTSYIDTWWLINPLWIINASGSLAVNTTTLQSFNETSLITLHTNRTDAEIRTIASEFNETLLITPHTNLTASDIQGFGFSGNCSVSGSCSGIVYDGEIVINATSPAGADTQVQYNDGGSFGADAGLTTDKAGSLTASATISAEQLTSTDDITMAGVLTNTVPAADATGLDIDGATNPHTTGGYIFNAKISRTASGTGQTSANLYNIYATTTNSKALTEAKTGSYYSYNVGMQNSVTTSAAHTGTTTSGFADTTIGLSNNVQSSGTMTGYRIGGTYTNAVYGFGSNTEDRKTYNNAAGTWSSNVYGSNSAATGRSAALVAGTLTLNVIGSSINSDINGIYQSGGTLTTNVYGDYIYTRGDTKGTSNLYGLYIANADSSDTNWAIYNAETSTSTHNFLGGDNIKTYFGTGKDAYVSYDGTNMIINPKEVGSGKLQVLGNINATNINASGRICDSTGCITLGGGTDTNASTACPGSDYLGGDGSCYNITVYNETSWVEAQGYLTSIADSNASTACNGSEVLVGSGECINISAFNYTGAGTAQTNLTKDDILGWDFLNATNASNFVKQGEILINNTSPHTNLTKLDIQTLGFINLTEASAFNETLLITPHTNLTYSDIQTLGFSGNCSESDSCSNIVYDGEIVINGSTPHTNRTDAEIRTIASEFNETLWVQAQGYLTSYIDTWWLINPLWIINASGSLAVNTTTLQSFNETSLITPHTNRTDAEIRTIASEFNETLLITPHTNLTYANILSLGFSGNCSESGSCSSIVYDGELIINGSTPHTNRTDAEIRTIASEFNETLLITPQTNRTDAEIRSIASEFNETLLITPHTNVTLVQVLTDAQSFNQTLMAESINNTITPHTNRTDAEIRTIASEFNETLIITPHTNLTASDILGLGFSGNCSIANSCSSIVYEGEIIINGSTPHTNLTKLDIQTLGFINLTEASAFNETLLITPHTNRTDVEIRTIASEFNETTLITPHTNLTDADITTLGYIKANTQYTGDNNTIITTGTIFSINETTMKRDYNYTGSSTPHTNRTDTEIRSIASEFNETITGMSMIQPQFFVNLTLQRQGLDDLKVSFNTAKIYLNASLLWFGTIPDSRIPSSIARDSELTPHTNRTDAEIRNIASEFNETLLITSQTNKTDAEIRIIASEFNETLLITPHTNLTYADILSLGFSGNCSESNSCSNIVYEGEIIINGSTPHTNRTDAEIRTIASEFNETLLITPHTNRTDAEIRIIAGEFNETLLITPHTNVTLVQVLTDAQSFNQTLMIESVNNTITPHTNRTDAEIRTIASEFNETLLITPHTNLTDADITALGYIKTDTDTNESIRINQAVGNCTAGNVLLGFLDDFTKVCTADQAGSGVSKQADNDWLYNDSTTIYFNRTKAQVELPFLNQSNSFSYMIGGSGTWQDYYLNLGGSPFTTTIMSLKVVGGSEDTLTGLFINVTGGGSNTALNAEGNMNIHGEVEIEGQLNMTNNNVTNIHCITFDNGAKLGNCG